MKAILFIVLLIAPLLSSGQCLLEKLYGLTDVLRREIWEQAGVADSVPDSLSGWPDFMLDSLDWHIKYDFRDRYYERRVVKTYCPAYQVHAFIGDKAGTNAAHLDVNEVLCRWNEHRTVIQHYERGCFPGMDKQPLLDSLRKHAIDRHSFLIAWLKPDFTMELSFLYYGDSVRYMNPEDWQWNRHAQVGDTLKICQGDSVVVILTREDWKIRSDMSFGGDTTELLCPEQPKSRKGRRRKCYTEPTILEMKAGRLYVKDTMVYSGFEWDGDSIRLIPWQETLDKVYPSFAKHFNGLERWRSIRPSQRERIARWLPFSMGWAGRIPWDLLEKIRYDGKIGSYYFPLSDDPDTKDWKPLK